MLAAVGYSVDLQIHVIPSAWRSGALNRITNANVSAAFVDDLQCKIQANAAQICIRSKSQISTKGQVYINSALNSASHETLNFTINLKPTQNILIYINFMKSLKNRYNML